MSASPIPFPLINGNRFSWASIVCSAIDEDLTGLRSISYKTNVARSEVRGAGRQRLGFTAGNVSHDASFSMLKEEWENFVSKLDSFGPYLDQVFDIVVTYTDDNNTTRTDFLVGCRIKGESDDRSNGTDGLEVKVDLDIMYLVKQGLNNDQFEGFVGQ